MLVQNKMADTKATVEKLNDGNYAVWKFKMRLLLTKEKLLKVVTDPKPTTADATWVETDAKAQAVIGLALEDTQLIHVMTKKTAKEMWDALKDYHERASLSSIIHVVRQLITIRMTEDGNMAEHLKEMTALRLRLTALGEEVKDNWFVALMLSSLPRSYDGLIVALESRPDADLTVDFVKGKLLDEGRRRVDSESRGDNRALVVSSAKSKSAGKPKVKKEVLCHYCKKTGHFRRDCQKMAHDKREKEKPDGAKANVAVKSDSKFEVCLAAGRTDGSGFWYLDSGATAHMTSDTSLLDDVDRSKATAVCLADGKSIKSSGTGTGKLVSFNGDGAKMNVRLDNVLHVPSLAGNLLSVSRIADLGFRVLFDQKQCHVLKGEESVLVGQRKGGLYHLKQAPESALLVNPKHSDLCKHLWHRRLGHRDVQAVDKIVRDNLGHGLKLDPCEVQSVCGPCCEGKMIRESFPKVSDSKSCAVGDLVHTDLGGPMEEDTPSGNRFYIVLVDDYTRYGVVYLLRRKSEAEDRIREYCSLVKNQFGHLPKRIRSDGGGEYLSGSLRKYFAESGIVHELTAPYSPQQNGVAERKNRYLVEMVRCMLSESKLQKRYWGEAICTANYLQNRLPSSVVAKTPYELWHGKKPSYGHLRVFGSETYVHVPKEKRRKLDHKAEKLIFVGYADGRKAYRFLNPGTDMITVSRDAKFLEQCKTQEVFRRHGVETG